MNIEKEVAKRRTFAIISHPDAGKTTLTEKLLYLGGVIHQTGEVKGKAGSRAVTSDYMELERQKGISITSSVMTFDYNDLRINLLDTPGHKDFSEDTYRVLTAVDSACMLMDSAKGVEERTRKLYEVCRLRHVPIFTFMNKVDRESKDPLELLDEVEKTLAMSCFPITWPVGLGQDFQGLYHRFHKKFYLYTRGSTEAELFECALDDHARLAERFPERVLTPFLEQIQLVEGMFTDLNAQDFLDGKVSPLTWGSAKLLYGVDFFLELFCSYAPPPQPRHVEESEDLEPTSSEFAGFVFKIQANMDKRHRDRIAFVRICSGQFERGMKVFHNRHDRELRLQFSNQFVASDRETVDIAYAGDIIGVGDTGYFAIGDSISSKRQMSFEPMPRFAPELFSKIKVGDALKRRKLQEALIHLSEEGAIQLFYDPHVGLQDLIIGVVGELQFEVLLHRLEEEYNLKAQLQHQNYTVARWPRKNGQPFAALKGQYQMFQDLAENPVILLAQEWDLKWFERENPDVEFATSIQRVR